MKTHQKLQPVYWSLFIFILAIGFAFLVISREDPFLKSKNLYLPSQPSQAVTVWPGQVTSPSGAVTQVPVISSLGPILIYFFAVVVVLGLVLFLIPLSALKLVFKLMYAFLYCWSIFVICILWLPLAFSLGIAVVVGVLWFFYSRVWLHTLVMILAMVALGAVFGRFIAPWTAMIFLAILAIYDFLAVRFGYMMWMAKKLSASDTLPAFIIPYQQTMWNSKLSEAGITKITEEKPEERKFAVLGGGDVGIPLLLVCSVYFSHGPNRALVMAIFCLAGLVSAYWIQLRYLKGKAMPALPPIAVLSVIGLSLISFIK